MRAKELPLSPQLSLRPENDPKLGIHPERVARCDQGTCSTGLFPLEPAFEEGAR